MSKVETVTYIRDTIKKLIKNKINIIAYKQGA